MGKFGLAAAAALSVLLTGFAAQAANLAEVNFTISGVAVPMGIGLPYGLSANPTLTGSFKVDLDQVQPKGPFYLIVLGSGISDLEFQVGTRLFTDADLNAMSEAIFTGDAIAGIATLTGFQLFFDAHNRASSGQSIFTDDKDSASITTLATFTNPPITVPYTGPSGGIPEPSTWALMIAGFAMAGTALRRQATLNTAS